MVRAQEAKVDDDRRQQLASENAGKVNEALVRINREYENLEQMIAKVEKLAANEETKKALNDRVRTAVQQFAGITRR